MRLPRLRLFTRRNRSPHLDGVGGALEEAFDFRADEGKMEADLERLIDELSEVEGTLADKAKRKR